MTMRDFMFADEGATGRVAGEDGATAAAAPGAPGDAAPGGAAQAPWKVLVVDDDPDVREATRLALRRVSFRGAHLAFLEAGSADEALRIAEQTRDLALVMLDVVMETDDAGLRCAREIRERLGNRLVRIVLRTGQPGLAPERSVIDAYDINDYKAKTELTADRLYTTIVVALRSYADLVTIERSRRGLRKVIEASDRLLEDASLRTFAAGVLSQLSAVVDAQPNGMLCAVRGDPLFTHAPSADVVQVIAASGRFEDVGSVVLDDETARGIGAAELHEAFRTRSNVYSHNAAALRVEGAGGIELGALLAAPVALGEIDRDLLEVFARKLAGSFGNVVLYETVRRQNRELERRVAERTAELVEANTRLADLARKDPLTSAFNRRTFIERLDESLAADGALAVAIVDLDHFKRINDTYGHPAGDEVLRETVRRAGAVLPADALFARFGGEEFAVLLPGGRDDGRRACEALRRALAEAPVRADGHDVSVTASVGVAERRPGEEAASLIARADAALYRAKSGGRDRVETDVPSDAVGSGAAGIAGGARP